MKTRAVAGTLLVVAVACGCGADTANEGEPTDSLLVPDFFGSAELAASNGEVCDAYKPLSAVALNADGYEPGAEVTIVMQLVGEDPVAVKIVSADDAGVVGAEVEIPDRTTGSLGGFELIGRSLEGVLLNEAAFFVDEDGCGATG